MSSNENENDQPVPSSGSPQLVPPCNPRSADDILNELFNELGSKNPGESLASFLNPAKKKKKIKKEKDRSKDREKEKKKKKEKLKEKDRDKERRKVKKHKKSGEGDYDHDDYDLVHEHKQPSAETRTNIQHASPTKKRKIVSDDHDPNKSSKKSSRSPSKAKKAKVKKETVDIEEGEIVDKVKDKDKHSRHPSRSKKHQGNDVEKGYISDGIYDRSRHSERAHDHDRDAGRSDYKYGDPTSSYEPSAPVDESYSKLGEMDRHRENIERGFDKKSRYFNDDRNRDRDRGRDRDRDRDRDHDRDRDRDRDRDFDSNRKTSPSRNKYDESDNRSSSYRHSGRSRSPSYRRSDDHRFDNLRQPSNKFNNYNNRRSDYHHNDNRVGTGGGGGRSNQYGYAPPRYSRSRSRSRSRPRHPSDIIDKPKLLEIARRNATLLMKKGVLPTDIFSRDQIVAIKAGGKSVEELTSYCRRLAKNESHGGDDFDNPNNSGNDSDGNEPTHFIHHPFVVKDRPMPQITLNIRNAVPLPVRTPQEMAIENAVRKTQFPVSSGCQHRYKEIKELEWKEVEKDTEKDKKNKTELALIPLPLEKKVVGTVAPTVVAPESSEVVETAVSKVPEKGGNRDTGISVEPPMLPHVDIGSVISARLKAMRTLKENPESEEAKNQLTNAIQEMDQWAQAKALEPKFLTASDLQTGPQAWAKRDQLKNAKEVQSGMGMHLLQKMGWRPGEGLGKNKEGTTEPLALDVKTDKKGLTSVADLKVKGPQTNLSMIYDLSGKHPVSALMELCTKRRWGPPAFDLCFEHGPPHQKSFVFKVTVNGVEYQPCVATNNKKLAKANAAAFCLQSLGLLKANPQPTAPAETLQTVPPLTGNPAMGPGPVQGPGPMGDLRMISSHLLQTVAHSQ